MIEAIRKLPPSLIRLALGHVPDLECLLPERVEQRLTAVARFRSAGGDDKKLRSGRRFGAPEHRRRDEVLSHHTVRLGQLFRKRNGDCTHREVDSAPEIDEVVDPIP